VDQPGDVAEPCGCLDQRVHRLARRDIDGLGADVEAGVPQYLGRGVGVRVVQVGQDEVLAGADAPGDRLTDRPCSDNDDDLAHEELLTWGSGGGR